jgi:hypothetical protein
MTLGLVWHCCLSFLLVIPWGQGVSDICWLLFCSLQN